jgi:hypothetical protein
MTESEKSMQPFGIKNILLRSFRSLLKKAPLQAVQKCPDARLPKS